MQNPYKTPLDRVSETHLNSLLFYRLMRILQFNDNYKHHGGVETYFLSLFELLKKKEDAYLFSFGKSKIKDRKMMVCDKKRGNIIRRSFSAFVFDVSVYKFFKSFVKAVKPDITHLHHNQYYTNSILKVIKKYNLRIIQTIHDFTLICPKGWCIMPNGKVCSGGMSLKCLRCIPLHHFIVLAIISPFRSYLTRKRVKYLIAPSKSLKSYLQRHGFRNVFHLPYFIDAKSYKLNISKPKKNKILFIGRLRPEKGVKYLIKAMPLIVKQVPDAELLIVGDGIEKKELMNLAIKLNLKDNINFEGIVNNKKIWRYYEMAKVNVVPSIWMENSPLVIYESMAYGTPVVGTNRGGIPELIDDNKTGLIAKACDEVDLSKKIIKLLKDTKLAKKLALNARKKVEREYSAEKHLEKLKEIYIKIIHD